MISFYPGPSKVHKDIGAYMQEAVQSGILSQNHRSEAFKELSFDTIELLKLKLEIPSDYWIFYTSSATECWEIIAQSLIRKKSAHLYNGAFGEKWMEYTANLTGNTQKIEFDINSIPETKDIKIEDDCDLICITQNETSNGTQLSNQFIKEIKRQNPEKILALDATSSMAGVYLDFSATDICFASVQKCFGLPAGMAIMVCSPKAIEKALAIGENKHYNSLCFMIEKMKDFQTTYTPNVLSIFLLNRVLASMANIRQTDQLIRARSKDWYSFFREDDLLIRDPASRSDTVIAVKGEEDIIRKIKSDLLKAGILLGNGYGQWAKNTFRIANFPAHEAYEIERLRELLVKII
jgi:phosphoserine aminotransferase